MWIILKFDKKKLNLMKNDFKKILVVNIKFTLQRFVSRILEKIKL